MGKGKTERGQQKDHTSHGNPLDRPQGKAGHDLADDDIIHRDRM